jgi:hypothetical protein
MSIAATWPALTFRASVLRLPASSSSCRHRSALNGTSRCTFQSGSVGRPPEDFNRRATSVQSAVRSSGPPLGRSGSATTRLAPRERSTRDVTSRSLFPIVKLRDAIVVPADVGSAFHSEMPDNSVASFSCDSAISAGSRSVMAGASRYCSTASLTRARTSRPCREARSRSCSATLSGSSIVMNPVYFPIVPRSSARRSTRRIGGH